MDDLQFYSLLNSISVISGCYKNTDYCICLVIRREFILPKLLKYGNLSFDSTIKWDFAFPKESQRMDLNLSDCCGREKPFYLITEENMK